MALPNIPYNFAVQQANGQVYASWNLASGATAYSLQRSTDGINYAILASPTTPYYLDTTVIIGTQYFYQVASIATYGGFATATLTFSGQPNPGDTVTIANNTF